MLCIRVCMYVYDRAHAKGNACGTQDFHHVMGFGMKTIHDAEHIFEGEPKAVSDGRDDSDRDRDRDRDRDSSDYGR